MFISDHIKTVTFANKPKLHHIPKENQWPDVIDYSYSHHLPLNHNNISKPSKPVLPMRDYVRSPNPNSSQNHIPHQSHGNFPKYGNKLSPITDTPMNMTSYDDDDETTTSGSYTIDNDHDWINETQPRPYYLSRNEAYC